MYYALHYNAKKGDANPLENCSQLNKTTRGEKAAKQASAGHQKLEEAATYDEAIPRCTHIIANLKSAIKPDGQVDQVGGEGYLDEAEGPTVVELEYGKDDGATYLYNAEKFRSVIVHTHTKRQRACLEEEEASTHPSLSSYAPATFLELDVVAVA